MTVSHKNRVQMSVSGTPGTGTITLGSAASGHQSLAAAYGGNATIPEVTVYDGTAWETFENAAYIHSGTTLSRGTFKDSSTGSALSLTSAAIVDLGPAASFANRLEIAMQAVMPGGRLTLESGVPVSTTDQTSKTTIYYTPAPHNTVPLWDGSRWLPVTFAEASLALGTLTSALEYAVFGYLSSGSLALESAAFGSATVTFTNATDLVNWTSTPAVDGDMFFFAGGTAPTGLAVHTVYFVRDKSTNSFKLAATPGGAAINFTTDGSGTNTGKLLNVTLQDGRWCKNGDKTRLYLGAFYTTSTTTTEDSITKRHVCNVYNKEPRGLFQNTNGGSYNGGDRDYNNNTGTELSWTCALPVDLIFHMSQRINGSSSNGGIANLLFDGVSGSAPVYQYLAGTQEATGATSMRRLFTFGRHYVRSRQTTSGTVTYSENVTTAEVPA